MFKNKGLVALVVIVLILLIGGGAYLMLSKASTPKPKQTAQNLTQAKPTANVNQLKSLVDLLATGQTLQCTFSANGTNGAKTQGTIYMSAGNIRANFNVTASDGKQSQGSMIRSGNTNYIWGSSFPEGIKMTMSLQELSGRQQTEQQFINPNLKTNYDCSSWTADDSLFNPPSNVKFMDISQVMQQANPSGNVQPTGATTQTGSSPCDSITNATAKAACLNALNQSGH